MTAELAICCSVTATAHRGRHARRRRGDAPGGSSPDWFRARLTMAVGGAVASLVDRFD